MNSIDSSSLVLSMPCKVTTANADMNTRLRLGALLDFLIQSAIKSADSLHAGFGNLSQQNLLWVLSRITIEIEKPLHWYQSGTVETWPKNVEKIMYLRDFFVKQDEQVVAKATSGWLAIDKESRRPRMLRDDYTQIFTALKNKHAIEVLPEKLIAPKEGEICEIKSSYFDIDVNEHVTASRYVDWMMDAFSVDFHKNNYPKKLSINYLNETWIHENIQIVKTNCGDNTFLFEGRNTSRNITAFLGKLSF